MIVFSDSSDFQSCAVHKADFCTVPKHLLKFHKSILKKAFRNKYIQRFISDVCVENQILNEIFQLIKAKKVKIIKKALLYDFDHK